MWHSLELVRQLQEYEQLFLIKGKGPSHFSAFLEENMGLMLSHVERAVNDAAPEERDLAEQVMQAVTRVRSYMQQHTPGVVVNFLAGGGERGQRLSERWAPPARAAPPQRSVHGDRASTRGGLRGGALRSVMPSLSLPSLPSFRNKHRSALVEEAERRGNVGKGKPGDVQHA